MEGLNSGVMRTIQLLIRAGTEHTPSRLQFQCSWTLCLHSFFTVQTLSAFLLDSFHLLFHIFWRLSIIIFMVYMIPNQSQWCFWRGFVLFRVTHEYSIFFSVSVTHLFIRSAFWSPKFHTNDVNHWLLLLLVRSHAVFKYFSWAIIIIIVIFWILLRIDFFFCIVNQIFLINIPRFVNIFLSFSMMVYCCLPRRSDGAFFFVNSLSWNLIL